ncbi:hypothetical protein THAOC_33674, partial [Thalassiosira oceanica]
MADCLTDTDEDTDLPDANRQFKRLRSLKEVASHSGHAGPIASAPVVATSSGAARASAGAGASHASASSISARSSAPSGYRSSAQPDDTRGKPRFDEDIFELSCDKEETQASHWPAEARTTANKPGIGKSDDVRNKRTEQVEQAGEQEVIEILSSDEENELREKPQPQPQPQPDEDDEDVDEEI